MANKIKAMVTIMAKRGIIDSRFTGFARATAITQSIHAMVTEENTIIEIDPEITNGTNSNETTSAVIGLANNA